MTPATIAILGAIWGVIKTALQDPLINRALDNWTNGTSNKLDDMVWSVIESLAGAKHLTDEQKSAELTSRLTRINEIYEEAKANNVAEVMTTPMTSWDTTGVVASLNNAG